MPTLRQIHRKCLEWDSDLYVGDRPSWKGASGTATTVVVTEFGQGSLAPLSNQLQGKYLVRFDCATGVDRWRIIKTAAFVAGTGTTFTHDGTNYSDTTLSGELVHFYRYHPGGLDVAIRTGMARVRHDVRTVLPGYKGGRYYFGANSTAPWVKEASHVRGVYIRNSAEMTQNGEFEQWNTMGTGGTVTPADGWVLAGAGASVSRVTSNVRRGAYCARLTRSGADATLTQTIGLLWTGVAADSMQSMTVIALLAGTPDNASQGRIRISDGVNTTNSSYLTTSVYGTVQSAVHTLDASATTLTVSVRNEVDGNLDIDRCGLFWGSAINDSDLRGEWGPQDEEPVSDFWDQSAGAPALWLPALGMGRQYVVKSTIPYPQFDETRVAGDAADADSTDAPVETVAAAALYEFWKGRDEKKADYWRNESEALIQAHIYVPEPAQGGKRVLRPLQNNPVRMFRGR